MTEGVLKWLVMHAEQGLWRRCHNEALSIVRTDDGAWHIHLGSMPGATEWEFQGHGPTLANALEAIILDVQVQTQIEPTRAG